MKPYYEADGITLYCGDCRDVLPHVSADVVVTDPPYGIHDKPFSMGPMGGSRRGDNTWHPPSDWDAAIDVEWCQLSEGAASVVAWFGHWRKRHEVESMFAAPIRCEIVWVKDMHCGPPCPAAMQDERIWLFSKHGIEPQRFETTTWIEPVIPTWAHKHHKNEKPVRLMCRLVSWLAGPADVVLDPFAGSGTTLVAAKQLGRKAIGIEIEERYCAIAVKRLAQTELFAPLDAAPRAEQLAIGGVK